MNHPTGCTAGGPPEMTGGPYAHDAVGPYPTDAETVAWLDETAAAFHGPPTNAELDAMETRR